MVDKTPVLENLQLSVTGSQQSLGFCLAGEIPQPAIRFLILTNSSQIFSYGLT